MNDEILTENVNPESLKPVSAPGEAVEEEATQVTEVISVDELLERLAASEEPTEEEVTSAAEETAVEEGTPLEPVEVAGMEETLQLLETIQQDVTPHPFLTTDFEDYTVTEGLLLLILLLAIIFWCVKILKEAFSWL